MANDKFFKVEKNNSYILYKEAENIKENRKKISDIKDKTIAIFESKKLDLKRRTDANNYFNKKGINNNKLEKAYPTFMSIRKKEELLSLLDREISLIQNKYDNICNDLRTLKSDTDEKIKMIKKTKESINILNYKMYELRYNYNKGINRLTKMKDNCASGDLLGKGESQTALDLLEKNKEIVEYEQSFALQLESIKQQKLELETEYKNSINILVSNLEITRNNCKNLIALIEAENDMVSKSHQELLGDKYLQVLEELQNEIDTFTHQQTVDGKLKPSVHDFTGSSSFVIYFKFFCYILVKKYNYVGI